MSRGPPNRTDWETDRSGQSDVVGVVLILGLAMIGITAILVFGGDALSATQQQSHVQRASQGMTLLDAKIAEVGLGDTSAQQVTFGGAGDGRFEIDEDAGWIKVVHFNYTGSEPAKNETVLNQTLGAVLYRNDESTIAYQGGGVWLHKGNGTAMVSPPEFHYRSATLTLPILRVTGSGGAGGDARATITPITRGRRLFPNLTATGGNEIGAPYNDTSRDYLNPVENGTINVTVHSQYYEGWAEYFRTRTEGEVSVDHANNTATVELITVGDVGDFQMPQDGQALKIRGIAEGHPVGDFSFTLYDDLQDNADFDNLKWSFWAETGGMEYELHVRKGDSNSPGGPCGDFVKLYTYFSPSGTTSYHGWKNVEFTTIQCDDYDGDGEEEKKVEIDLTSSTDMEYFDIGAGGGGNLLHFSLNNQDWLEPAVFDEHENSVSWESVDFSGGETTTIHRVTDHYFGLLGPSFDLWVADKSGNTVNEDQSEGTLNIVGTGAKYITYLHITKNKVKVEIK